MPQLSPSIPAPFVLLDDARPSSTNPARLYTNPVETIVARTTDDVTTVLETVDAWTQRGLFVAGYLAYEAGLAIEPCLTPLAPKPGWMNGPLAWFGAFSGYETITADTMPQWLESKARAPAFLGPMEPAQSYRDYEQAFAQIHAAIHAGDIYQANLTFPLIGPWQGDPLALYAAIRPHAAAGYGGVIHDGSQWILSFSPELFFGLSGREVSAKPMKGTRPRGHDLESDTALAAQLAQSAKDRAENLMIVDLMRNDLSRIAETGSVRVTHPFTVESYPTVHQMVSAISARLEPGRSVSDILRALFPCGSITGAPKIRAMELISAIEPAPRGVYCGAIGRIDPPAASAASAGHNAVFNVTIRTLQLSEKNPCSGTAVLSVGSAIVADSQALSEWRECLVKGEFVRKSQLESFDLVETMAYWPGKGIGRISLHLDRMAASADTLRFVFDRPAIERTLNDFCKDTKDTGAPARLRLMLARSGAYSIELGPMPPPIDGVVLCLAIRLPVDNHDWRLAHKTTDRAFHTAALNLARHMNAHEAIYVRDDGLVTEGSFTNLFVKQGDQLITPPLALGLLPGVLRRELLDSGQAKEAPVRIEDLAQGFLIGNALRGLIPARLKP